MTILRTLKRWGFTPVDSVVEVIQYSVRTGPRFLIRPRPRRTLVDFTDSTAILNFSSGIRRLSPPNCASFRANPDKPASDGR